MKDDVHGLFLGVFSGLSTYFGFNPFYLRISFFIATLFLGGNFIFIMAIFYFILSFYLSDYDNKYDSLEVEKHYFYR